MLTRRTFLGMTAAAPFHSAWAKPQPSANQSPRCFLTPARLAQAKKWKDGPLTLAWKRMEDHCDAIVKDRIANYRPPSAHDGEMLWQRNVGNALPTLALGFLLSGNSTYRQFAFAQAVDTSTYQMWGGPDAKKEGVDLAAGHLLFGIGLLVDWLGHEMDTATRTVLLNTLKRRGTQMAAGSATIYWSQTWLQNHLWVCMTGLLAAGLALERYDADAARPLISTAMQRMQPCFPVLAEDGSDQEGPAYWTYGTEYLLKYHHLATEVLGQKIDSPWLRNTAEYSVAMTLPLASVDSRQSIFDTADALLTPYYGPEYLLRRLAALNHDSAAQEMAGRLEKLGALANAADWLNFIWYDPAVPANGLSSLPTLQHFADLDLVVARSDRSGNESAIVMRAGPPLGHRVQAMHIAHDIGTAHTHPDVNHLTLFGRGEFLLLDNGYAAVKDTAQHNTLLVGGIGQVGSGAQWTKWPAYPIPDPQPSIQAINSKPMFDYWVGEGAAAYPSKTGLTRFDRHILFLKPDVLVVIDDIEAQSESEFTLLWHPGAKPVSATDNSFAAAIGNATLRMQFVSPKAATITPGVRHYPTHETGDQALHELAIVWNAKSAQCASAFSWAAKGKSIAAVAVTETEGIWTIRSRQQTFALDVGRRLVTIA